MCAPPAILAVAAAGVAATGQIVGGLSQAKSYRYQAKIADANAKEANGQILDGIQRGVIERAQLDRKYADLQGQQQATMASNGIDLSFGSAAQVAADTRMYRNEDADALYRNQNDELHGYGVDAANSRAQAVASRQKASGAIIAGAFGAAYSILGGASQLKGMQAPVGATGSATATSTSRIKSASNWGI